MRECAISFSAVHEPSRESSGAQRKMLVDPYTGEIDMLSTQRSRASRAAKRIRHFAAPLRHNQFTAHGAQTVRRLGQAVREGNVLRIRIRDAEGRTLIEIPLLLGVRGGHRLEPVWAAVRALANSSGQLTVEVSRETAWPQSNDDYVTEWDPRLS